MRCSDMLTFALTGGIATGKSTVCRLIREELPAARIFDSDACVGSLLDGDPVVVAGVRTLFGAQAVTAAGTVDRDVLRKIVFADPASRERLEGLLHPRVREDCLASRDLAVKEGAALFVADIPLLFEKDFDFGQERSLISATTRVTQVLRLK
ncbi:MAG: dephospho-CoA kinase, partial [Verrucomicrobiales bacterium]